MDSSISLSATSRFLLKISIKKFPFISLLLRFVWISKTCSPSLVILYDDEVIPVYLKAQSMSL